MRHRVPGRPCVGDDLDLLAGDAPVDVALAQEAARRDEAVDGGEMRLEEALAQQETVRADLREAAMTLGGRCAGAALPVTRPQHQPVMMADRIIVVQRHHDRRLRQEPPRQRQELGADQHEMVDVDDIRPEFGQQRAEVLQGAVMVDLAEVEAVEMTAPQQQVAVDAGRLEGGAGMWLAVDRVGRTEEEHLAALGAIGLRQIMGENLRATGVEIGVVMGDDQDAPAHRAPPGFTATRRS